MKSSEEQKINRVNSVNLHQAENEFKTKVIKNVLFI